jgi:rubrerythrin
VEQQKTEHAAQKKENAEALLHTRMQKFIAAVRKDLGEGKYFCPCCGTLMQSGQAKKDRMTSSCPNCMAVLTLYAR